MPGDETLVPSASPERENRQLRREQVDILYRHLPVVLLISAVVALALAYGLWDISARPLLGGWLAAMGLLIAGRVAGLVLYRRAAPVEDERRWALWAVVGSGLSGVLWGLAGVAFYPPGELEHQFFILFVLMGMGAGALTSLTAYPPAFYAYFPITLLPLSLYLATQPGRVALALSIMSMLYVLCLTFFARNISLAITASLKLRFENIQLVRDLSAQKEQAEHANISKSKFLAAASHDLRQPLHALTLFTSALNERIHYPEVRKIVDNINASVQALERLFNALLDISRLEAGVLQPEIRDFHLQSMIDRLGNDVAPAAEEKGLALRVTRCDETVRGDAALLEQILRNYLANAIRYTERGSVSLSCLRQDGQLRIDVIDTGIGIPPNRQRDIFQEFYQLGNPERDRSKGLGLGLAIVERIAALLGHRIEVESAPGRGSRFSVTVPLGDAAAVEAPAAAESSVTGDLGGLRVLVVEDEDSVRAGMDTLLQGWGCRPLLAASAGEALALLAGERQSPEVIVADYRLRDQQTGTDAIQRIRAAHGERIPALIITGDTAIEQLRDVKASGYPVLHKPVPPPKLRAFLRNVRKRG